LLTTNARRPIKGSKDADFRLVAFTKKNQKNAPWGWGRHPQKKTQIQNFQVFLVETRRLSEFLRIWPAL